MSVGHSCERGVASISLDVPQARNALDLATISEMRRVLTEVRQNPGLRLVILKSGVDRVFSLGMNLAQLEHDSGMGIWESFEAISVYADLLMDLAEIPVPTLAVVDGLAAGGGVELACVCDTVFCTTGSSFAIAQLRKGIFPFITSAVLAPRIGQGRFLHWALSGQSFTAKRLFELGLVHQICSPEEMARSVGIFADRVLGFDAKTLRAGLLSLRTEGESELRGRIRHALALFTLNCLAVRGGATT